MADSKGPRFDVFDKDADTDRSQRLLPHWFQPNVAVFLTFRTADSLPREVLQRWDDEQRDWLQRQGWDIGPNNTLPDSRALPASLRGRFRTHRDGRWHRHLDACQGECLLRRPELSKVVADSLRHFDGDRYDLDCFVVMPNHVHVLVQFRPPTTCRQQCKSWLRYTARQINQAIGRSGEFWQSEPFDHLVRSAEQFEYLQCYIKDNPSKAHLREGEYVFWKREWHDTPCRE